MKDFYDSYRKIRKDWNGVRPFTKIIPNKRKIIPRKRKQKKEQE